MWTEITRPKYERKGLGYSSDLSDPEWAMIEPRLPQRNRLGRPPKTELRRVVNALLYMVRTGCQWRQLPREFPPYTTGQHYFDAWRDSGVLQRIISSCCCKLAKRPDASQAPRLALLIARLGPPMRLTSKADAWKRARSQGDVPSTNRALSNTTRASDLPCRSTSTTLARHLSNTTSLI